MTVNLLIERFEMSVYYYIKLLLYRQMAEPGFELQSFRCPSIRLQRRTEQVVSVPVKFVILGLSVSFEVNLALSDFFFFFRHDDESYRSGL